MMTKSQTRYDGTLHRVVQKLQRSAEIHGHTALHGTSKVSRWRRGESGGVDARDEDVDERADAALAAAEEEKDDGKERASALEDEEDASSVAVASEAVIAAILRFLLSGSPPFASATVVRVADSETAQTKFSTSPCKAR